MGGAYGPYKCHRTECRTHVGFTYQFGLWRHNREVHPIGGEKPQYFCTLCRPSKGRKAHPFTRKGSLKRHLELVHKESNPCEMERSVKPSELTFFQSSTEPTTRQKAAKKAMFPNPPASAGKRKTPMNGISESESRASSHQSKRPKYSTEPSETFPAAQHSESTPIAVPKTPKTPLSIIKQSKLVFTEEVYEIISNYASELIVLHEAENNTLKEVFESARQRDVRRANEAEAQRNEAIAEYARRLKMKDAEVTEKLAAQKEQAQIDAQLESDRHEQEMALLKAQLEELKVSRERNVLVQSSAAEDDIRQQLARQKDQLKMYDQLFTFIISVVMETLKSRSALGEKADEVKVQHIHE